MSLNVFLAASAPSAGLIVLIALAVVALILVIFALTLPMTCPGETSSLR